MIGFAEVILVGRVTEIEAPACLLVETFDEQGARSIHRISFGENVASNAGAGFTPGHHIKATGTLIVREDGRAEIKIGKTGSLQLLSLESALTKAPPAMVKDQTPDVTQSPPPAVKASPVALFPKGGFGGIPGKPATAKPVTSAPSAPAPSAPQGNTRVPPSFTKQPAAALPAINEEKRNVNPAGHRPVSPLGALAQKTRSDQPEAAPRSERNDQRRSEPSGPDDLDCNIPF